jgi:hypothetical protein
MAWEGNSWACAVDANAEAKITASNGDVRMNSSQ